MFSKHLHLEKARAFFSHDYLTETFEKTMHAQKSICAENALDSHPEMWKASLFEEAYFLQDAVWLSSIKSWHNNKNEGSDDQKKLNLECTSLHYAVPRNRQKKKEKKKSLYEDNTGYFIKWCYTMVKLSVPITTFLQELESGESGYEQNTRCQCESSVCGLVVTS